MAELETVYVDLVDLQPYYRNPRHGDVGAIAESLEHLGQFRTIVVNRGTLTGRENEVLAGNHTMRAAAALGWTELAVTFVDVDEDRAARIVLVDNRTNDLATYDEHELTELLLELQESPEGLAATGYDPNALDEMLDDLATSLTEELDRISPAVDLDRVSFKFGDYAGVVERDVYERFKTFYTNELAAGALLLDDVLRRWLPDD